MLDILAAILNSTIGIFFTEISGRVSLGDGALELAVEDARDHLLIPDLRNLEAKSRKSILTAFQSMLQRSIKSIFEEIHQADRQELDKSILLSMGFDPSVWLPLIYEGLTNLVNERIHLGQMRNQTRKNKPQKAARRVADEVLQDILPSGPLRFPDAFLSPTAQAGSFHGINLPVQYLGPMMGKEEIARPGWSSFYSYQ